MQKLNEKSATSCGSTGITGCTAGLAPMKSYLSMGFGVNSVAMYLMLIDQGVEFEAVYSDHGADYPETHEYIKLFTAKYHVTILKPQVSRPFGTGRKTWGTLVEYCQDRNIIPQQWPRWCTEDWKKDVVSKYVQKGLLAVSSG